MSTCAPSHDHSITAASLLRALHGPTASYVEAGLWSGRSRLPLRMILSTASAHKLPAAAVFTQALKTRAKLSSEVAADVELALHEAVSNAILHGNLGISSEGRDTVDGLAIYSQRVSERLADQKAGRRVVAIEAWWSARRILIGVTDEGDGFDLTAQGHMTEAAHGRGIFIMQAVSQGISWNQRRRRLLLTFCMSLRT